MSSFWHSIDFLCVMVQLDRLCILQNWWSVVLRTWYNPPSPKQPQASNFLHVFSDCGMSEIVGDTPYIKGWETEITLQAIKIPTHKEIASVPLGTRTLPWPWLYSLASWGLNRIRSWLTFKVCRTINRHFRTIQESVLQRRFHRNHELKPGPPATCSSLLIQFATQEIQSSHPGDSIILPPPLPHPISIIPLMFLMTSFSLTFTKIQNH